MKTIKVGSLVKSKIDFISEIRDPIIPYIIDQDIPLIVLDKIKSSDGSDVFFFLLYKNKILLGKKSILKLL